ncbi:hypothetical protein EV651_1236 [Kribbella sp. VKM Ac-2571]|uniref:hypothetical protein n=1 Tax=Kribbella sp. VKM Ac-2571 TaxID=2512222 RepID=UPI0010619E20|nr:hypothetical protein [Kribbella sp. VKM Ac-2571]TDO48240.1 hypothetical protein EV651_1236 [Kribbella sp. VKM Ac-2571]
MPRSWGRLAITAVRQAVAHAEDALVRSEPSDERPLWLNAFYDQAELENLALAGYLALGDYEVAEGHTHRSLAVLRPGMRRTRSITTARLAKAQLGQGDLEEAVATAMSIPIEPTGVHPRINSMLQDFGSTLRIAAPSSDPANAWNQYAHDSLRKHL